MDINCNCLSRRQMLLRSANGFGAVALAALMNEQVAADSAERNPASPLAPDLHATMLHLLGIDHTRLTHRFGGRDMRLTDVYGEVVQDILA